MVVATSSVGLTGAGLEEEFTGMEASFLACIPSAQDDVSVMVYAWYLAPLDEDHLRANFVGWHLSSVRPLRMSDARCMSLLRSIAVRMGREDVLVVL